MIFMVWGVVVVIGVDGFSVQEIAVVMEKGSVVIVDGTDPTTILPGAIVSYQWYTIFDTKHNIEHSILQ